MIGDILASFSAFLAVVGIGAAAFGAFRLYTIGSQTDVRHNIMLIGAILVAAGIGHHQVMAWWAWETGTWSSAPFSLMATFLYRLDWAFGLLALAGAASWPRCGHRGWLALLAIGGAAWMVAWAI